MRGLLVVLLYAGSLFADSFDVTRQTTFPSNSPATTNNDDSCEVIAAPAATLLLPYFEIDLSDPSGETTLFTITNVGQRPQIAHVTIWTDRALPVLEFSLFLTGYDVQAINLVDVLARGVIAEPGASSENRVGRRSLENDENPLLEIGECDEPRVHIPDSLLSDVRSALTTGRLTSCGTQRVGESHTNAIGYATIDVVRSCQSILPTDAGYFTNHILWDNVLAGDYQQVRSFDNFAQGAPMVHIRAVPEGGDASSVQTNLTRTFYGAYQDGGKADRRQPLPAIFAARWISGGPTGFESNFKIWRQGFAPRLVCGVSDNANLPLVETVVFDEEENPSVHLPCAICSSPPFVAATPVVSRYAISDSIFPPPNDDELAGWIYLNLNHGFVPAPGPFPTQNWVTVSMGAEGRYSVNIDAAALGNGCSATVAETDLDGGAPAIEPARDATPRFSSGSPSTINNDDTCDIRVAPAATLLLPYFEVDLESPFGETTLFSVTNVTPSPQIARVTMWTDWAFPLFTYTIFLTGYDVQSVNLYDVLVTGNLFRTTSDTDVGVRSAANDSNPLLDITNCTNLASHVPASLRAELQQVLTRGRGSACGATPVGFTHRNAIGYLTIDVVDNCGIRIATDVGYFTEDVIHENALLGDYYQVNSTENFAQGNSMVHIRAIPEGGAAGTGGTDFKRTFYSRFQNGGTLDRRQPLPSTFAARWISGGTSSFNGHLKIWRDGLSGPNAGCAVSSNASPLIREIVRFDEAENATTNAPCIEPPGCDLVGLPSTSLVEAHDEGVFPPNDENAIAGWFYLNLLNRSVGTAAAATQNWVVVSMRAEGRYSADFDATILGNGCSPGVAITDLDGGQPAIGPAPNVTPNP